LQGLQAFFAAQGLQGPQDFLAAQGLHDLPGAHVFFAAQGLQPPHPRLPAQGLHAPLPFLTAQGFNAACRNRGTAHSSVAADAAQGLQAPHGLH
jgi:hypothetical protein